MESLFDIQGDASSDLSPLFLIHAVSGFALPFLALGPLSADTPSTSRPVYGLSCPIYQYKSYRLPHSLDEVAREYVARIQSERPHGPYVLGGWSMGRMIAVRMAAILEEQGEEVLHVLLIDSANPQGCPKYVDESERSAVGEWTYNAYSKPTGLPGLEAMAGEEESFDRGSDESDGQDCDDDVDILEYLPRMKEHIYNSWDMINRAGQADDLARGLASPVTLVKCTSLAAPPPGISEERKHAIRHRFEDDCAGWTMEKLKVIPVNAQHDDVFDGDHIDVVTDILRGVLERIKR